MSKILLFTEIYECGGVDTFIINLLNKWPKKEDSFVLIANENYPGLQIIEENLKRRCEIIRYQNSRNSSLFSKNNISKLFFVVFFRYVLIFYNVLAFRSLVLKNNSGMLMVINGGYPGGDCCRAFAISWGLFSGRRSSIHNFHNIAQKARWYLIIQERLIDSLVCFFTSRFVTVSKAAATSMAVRPLIHKENKTSYIYNGFCHISKDVPSQCSIRREINVSNEAPLSLMLAAYQPRKGHHFLLQAFKIVTSKIPDAQLLICGFGVPDSIKTVAEYVKKMGLDNHVHLMNFRIDASRLIASCDVLVVPSQSLESFGYTSVEAMAQKVPVVATDVGGIPEVVVNNEGGYCINRQDIEAYAQHIILLLSDKKLRKEQSERGYLRYKEKFTAEIMAAKYAQLFHDKVIEPET